MPTNLEHVTDMIEEKVARPVRNAFRKAKDSKSRARRILAGENGWQIRVFADDAGETLVAFDNVTTAAEARRALRSLHALAFLIVRAKLSRVFPDARVSFTDKHGDTIRTKLASLLQLARNGEREAIGLSPKPEK